jgi:hypothetical protein
MLGYKRKSGDITYLILEDNNVPPIESVKVSNWHSPELYVKKDGPNSVIMNFGDGSKYEQITEQNCDIIGLSVHIEYDRNYNGWFFVSLDSKGKIRFRILDRYNKCEGDPIFFYLTPFAVESIAQISKPYFPSFYFNFSSREIVFNGCPFRFFDTPEEANMGSAIEEFSGVVTAKKIDNYGAVSTNGNVQCDSWNHMVFHCKRQ